MSERTTESPARVLRTRAGSLDHATYERRARQLRREALGRPINKAIRWAVLAWSGARTDLKSAGERRRVTGAGGQPARAPK